MSRKLTPTSEREPRNLHAELTYADFTRDTFKTRTRPNDDALRIAKLDFTTASDAEIIAELEKIREVTFQAAEAQAGMDDVDYWDLWQFDKICSPELVVRLCDLILT